jgi:hypothetical protein
MGVRAKRSHAGPAVRGGAISFAAGRGSVVGARAKTGTTGPNCGTTGRFRARGQINEGQLVRLGWSTGRDRETQVPGSGTTSPHRCVAAKVQMGQLVHITGYMPGVN